MDFKNLEPKAWRVRCPQPSLLPATGKNLAQQLTSRGLLVLKCVCVYFLGHYEGYGKVVMESKTCNFEVVVILVLSDYSNWDFNVVVWMECLLSFIGDEWLFEPNFVPLLPSFIKHLMITGTAIKSRWFKELKGYVFQLLYLDCLQPRRYNAAECLTCSI